MSFALCIPFIHFFDFIEVLLDVTVTVTAPFVLVSFAGLYVRVMSITLPAGVESLMDCGVVTF